MDFATPYIRHVLGFLGITDVEVIAAARQMSRGAEAVEGAHTRIDTLITRAA